LDLIFAKTVVVEFWKLTKRGIPKHESFVVVMSESLLVHFDYGRYNIKTDIQWQCVSDVTVQYPIGISTMRVKVQNEEILGSKCQLS
jgi:hypothetical protein